MSSTFKIACAAVLALAGLAAAPAALAHHSFAEYDDKKTVTISGTIKDVNFENPHIGVMVVSMANGQQVTWSFHGPSPADWRRDGWKKSDIKVGDAATIIGFPKRDTPLEASINIFTRTSDGKTFGKKIN